MSKRALVVEDDANIAELLRLYLGKDGFDVMIAADGGKAESSFDLFSPDVVLLDIMLPVKDGWQICRDIRKKSSVPIIMLTAKGETADKINGLDMGADDYVTKPFDVKELLARVHAVMRRTDADAPVEKKLTFDKLVINLESYELIVDGVKIDTPPKEMELLYHLAASPNRVFTRNQLLDDIAGICVHSAECAYLKLLTVLNTGNDILRQQRPVMLAHRCLVGAGHNKSVRIGDKDMVPGRARYRAYYHAQQPAVHRVVLTHRRRRARYLLGARDHVALIFAYEVQPAYPHE